MSRKYIHIYIIGVFLSSLFLVLINLIVDPFQIYKKATFHKTIFMKGFYLNAGLIKSYNYDSVCIGSSMTQNFILNDLKTKLKYKKPIKLPISGGNIVEHYTVLKSALNTNKVNNVLFGIDVFSLKNSENRLPKYLYDTNLFNDYKYLYSLDSLKRTLTYPFLHLTIPKSHPRLDYNLMFQWQHNHSESDFSRINVIENFNTIDINLDNDIDQKVLFTERINNFKRYILSLVELYPNVNFTFFYPPYSVLSYKSMSKDTLVYFNKTKIEINKILLKYNNVKLYDFQIEYKVISNLDNYKDLTHYHQKINLWMTEEMSKGNYLITDDNVLKYNDFENYIHKFKI